MDSSELGFRVIEDFGNWARVLFLGLYVCYFC